MAYEWYLVTFFTIYLICQYFKYNGSWYKFLTPTDPPPYRYTHQPEFRAARRSSTCDRPRSWWPPRCRWACDRYPSCRRAGCSRSYWGPIRARCYLLRPLFQKKEKALWRWERDAVWYSPFMPMTCKQNQTKQRVRQRVVVLICLVSCCGVLWVFN